MDFGLSDAQSLLGRSIADFARRNIPIERVRAVLDTGGDDPALHGELADQGVTGLLVPEEFGGSGLGLLDASVAAQALARAASPLSFHCTYGMAPWLLTYAGTDSQKSRWLPAIAEAGARLSVIPKPLRPGSSEALFVPDATTADAFLALVETEHPHLILIEGDDPELRRSALQTVDATRGIGELGLSDRIHAVEVPADEPRALFEEALQVGRILLSADALGAGLRGLELAVAYSKERQQFGRVIGSYQAVKHLCAEAIAELDPVQSLLWHTAWSWDQRLPDANALVCLLKAHACETASQVVSTATQVFGGIGFTHECDMHIYFKRVGYDRQMLGGPSEMRRRAADAAPPARNLSLRSVRTPRRGPSSAVPAGLGAKRSIHGSGRPCSRAPSSTQSRYHPAGSRVGSMTEGTAT